VPSPGKRTALYRDWVVMLLCRPFFKVVIYHWHAAGLGDWLHQEAKRWERWITHWLFDRHTLSLSLAVLGMRDALWFKAKNVKIVHYGIPDPCPDFDTTALPARRARVLARGKLLRNEAASPVEYDEKQDGPEIFKVLYLAHCTREKGIFDVLDGVALSNAAFAAADSPVRIQLTVAGAFMNGQEEAEFHARVAKPDMQFTLRGETKAAVKWLSFVSGDAKWALFRESDCFCFPSFYRAEALPVSLIEAMAFGLPIITTRWRAIPEILPPDYTVFVNANAPGEIATAFRSLVDRYEGEALRQRFLNLFSEKQYITTLKSAFRETPDPAA
jgi:glycosyltransferase involved in cell wall biosynthesis